MKYDRARVSTERYPCHNPCPASTVRESMRTHPQRKSGGLMREVIATNDAPKAIGPYSQAIKANGFVFISGQIPLDPATQQLIEGDVAAQTERCLLYTSPSPRDGLLSRMPSSA